MSREMSGEDGDGSQESLLFLGVDAVDVFDALLDDGEGHAGLDRDRLDLAPGQGAMLRGRCLPR